MNEYGVSDYSIFDNARTTCKTFMTEVEAFVSAVRDCNLTLMDIEVLEGNASEELKTMFEEIENDMNEISEKCTLVSNFIESVHESYQTGDKEALKKLLSVEEPETVSV